MNKDITYSSYATTPADYRCPDGQLAVALNLINEDGALRPISSPRTLHSGFGANDQIFIHHLPGGDINYICYRPDSADLFWMTADFSRPATSYITTVGSFISLSAIGNMIVITSAESMQYALWRDGKYVRLGERPPIPLIEFGLRSQTIRNSTIYADIPGISSDNWLGLTDRPYFPLNSDDSEHKTINDAIMAAVLDDAAKSAKANLFLTPFFVRYALRLLDESLYWHSAPVLMIPNLVYPYIGIGAGARSGDRLRLDPRHKKCSLDLRLLPYSGLGSWTSIIRSIDIFISPAIATYDQSKGLSMVGSLATSTEFRFGDKSLRKGIYRTASTTSAPAPDTYVVNWEDTAQTGRFLNFHQSEHSPAQQIPASFSFYKFASIPADQLQNIGSSFAEIKTEWLVSPSLDNLVTRELMSDDFAAHRSIVPATTFAYNNRFHAANLTVIPPQPYPLRTSVTAVTDTGDDGPRQYSMRVWLRKNGDIVSRALSPSAYPGSWSGYDWICDLTDPLNFPFFLYYPDPDAFRLEISCRGKFLILPLTTHEFLNGAYWSRFDHSETSDIAFTDSSTESDAAPSYRLPSSVYISDAANPFVFNPQSVVSIGSGRVLALSTAAKALSQGQFGQFPLYAFTDEGIWALEVSSTGVYSARQPIARDVCHNIAGITQIDSAVLFPSDRGIMLLSGSQTTCISEAVDSSFPFDLSTLPSLVNLQNTYLTGREPLSLIPFPQFIAGAFIIYDYPHQRIIASNPSCDYAYVYSFKSKAWGLLHSDITRPVISYPDALALTAAGDLVSYSDNDDCTPDSDSPFRTQFFVTRPLTLDAPDTLKTIDNIIQRGYFRKGRVKSLLYGSRDLINWHLITSSQNHHLRGFRGTPYKYFRIAAFATLNADESIFGASVQFEPRYTNKPR